MSQRGDTGVCVCGICWGPPLEVLSVDCDSDSTALFVFCTGGLGSSGKVCELQGWGIDSKVRPPNTSP